jgi:hypothetical protein
MYIIVHTFSCAEEAFVCATRGLYRYVTVKIERYPFLVMELMEVCSRHEVHFIADEVYALSVYDDTNSQFVSVLSLLPQARLRLLTSVAFLFKFKTPFLSD